MQAEASKLTAAKVPAAGGEQRQQQLTRVLHESFVYSFRTVMLIAAGLTLLSALCAALTIEDPQPAGQSRR